MTPQDLVVIQPTQNYLKPVADLESILRVYQAKKDFISKVLVDGVDFGSIPGGDKPALKKPGAEKITSFFGLSPRFEDVQTVEDWTGEAHEGEPFFYYRQKCMLFHGEMLIATADGSCNSWEKKYRYRNSERVCPQCGKPTIIKGKAEFGGGFVCFAKKGGCGAKFTDNDETITAQEVGQVKNPDAAELVNTILKMAQKRALVAAVLIGCGVSDYFTQDVDDFIDVKQEAATKGNSKLVARYLSLITEAEGMGLDVKDLPHVVYTTDEIVEFGKKLAGMLEKAKEGKA